MGSPLLRPNDQLDWLRGDAGELDAKLKYGDGMGFPGDPNLELRQGIVQALRRAQHPGTGKWLNKGDIVARRWEVWRHCEDGIDRMVGHWRMEEFDRILLDMSGLRMDSPGHVSSETLVDTHNATMEAERDQKMNDVLGETFEHGAKLMHDTSGPRNVFRGMPGLRDEGKDSAE